MLPKWIQDRKENAKQVYSSMPRPSHKYGIAITLDAGKFNPDGADPSAQSEKMEIKTDAQILSFSEAFEKFPEVLQSSLRSALLSDDKLSAFHAGNWRRGIVLYAPEGKQCTAELALPLSSTQADSIMVIADKHSTMNIIQRDSSSSRTYRSLSVDIAALDNSKVNYSYIQMLSADSSSVMNRSAHLSNDSEVSWYDAFLSSSATRCETLSSLIGDGSSSRHVSVLSSTGNQQTDILSKNVHVGRSTYSDIFTKGIVDDSAVSLMRGNITIEPSAFGSNGYQKEDVLILSKSAKANAIPELEIRNHDVKCSHGATIGQVDPSQLFYLCSRGITKEEATSLIVSGFLEAAVSRFPSGLQEELRLLIGEKNGY